LVENDGDEELRNEGEEREEIRKVQEKNRTNMECKEISSTAYGSQSKCENCYNRISTSTLDPNTS